MITFKQFITEEHDVIQSLYDADQAERNAFVEHLKKYSNREEGVVAWANERGRSNDDLFDDIPRLAKAKEHIQANIHTIKANPKQLNQAWLLVQHMDHDVAFQQEFHRHLTPGTTEHEYLTDRILVNQGKPQKFGTQNVIRPVEEKKI